MITLEELQAIPGTDLEAYYQEAITPPAPAPPRKQWPSTVRGLIAALEEQDPDAAVQLEGCDCVGDWDGTLEGVRSVMLCRR